MLPVVRGLTGRGSCWMRPRAVQLAGILLLSVLFLLTLIRYASITSSDLILEESVGFFSRNDIVEEHSRLAGQDDAKRWDEGEWDIPGAEVIFDVGEAAPRVDQPDEVTSMAEETDTAVPEQPSELLLRPSQEPVTPIETPVGLRRRLMVLQHFAPSSAGTSTDLQDVSRASHERYCQAWGYTYKTDQGDYTRHGNGHRGVNKVYSILAAVMEELAKPDGEGAEWILQVDADVLIYDPSVPLHALLPLSETDLPSRPLMLANQDSMGFNAGVVFYAVDRDMVDYLVETLAFESHERAQGRGPSDQHVLARTMEWGGLHDGDFLERPVDPPPPPPPSESQENMLEVRNISDTVPNREEGPGRAEAEERYEMSDEVERRQRRSRWSDRFYTIPMRWVNFYYARDFSDEGLQPDGGWTPQLHVHLVFHLKHDVDWSVYVREAEEVYKAAARMAAGYERPTGREDEVGEVDVRGQAGDEVGRGAAENLMHDHDHDHETEQDDVFVEPVSRFMSDPSLERGEAVGLTLLDGGKTAEAAHRWWTGLGRQVGIDDMKFSDI